MELVSSGVRKVWCPVGVAAGTLYVGQLVRQTNEGVDIMAVASGLSDQASKMVGVGLIHDGTSQNNVPFGIIVGTNKRIPTYSTTYKAESITYVAPSSATSEDYCMVEGWAKGDLMAMVEVAILDPTVVLRSAIYNAAFGTAPTVGTIASGASTLGATVNALEATGVASCATVYFRTGAAAGCYRVTDDASATALTWDLALTTTCAVGDTLVRINGLRPHGYSKCQLDATTKWIDCNEELTSNHFSIVVHKLDLSVPGKEYVEFTLNAYHFLAMDDIV